MKTIDDALFSTKWDLLQLIARSKNKTPTELARVLNTSLANITQQLKLLEAYGLVGKEKENNPEKKVGKPKLRYTLSKDVASLAVVGEGFAEKKSIVPTDYSVVFLKALLSASSEDAEALLKFLMTHDELMQKCKGIGLVKITKDSLELFLHTEFIDEIRKKHSHAVVADPSFKSKKIICWTHSDFEIDDGLKRKDPYFVNMFKNMAILLDKSAKLTLQRSAVQNP